MKQHTDRFGNPLNIGDKVVLTVPKYKGLYEGVVTELKECTARIYIEHYSCDWGSIFKNQRYCNIIKIPEQEV